MADGEVERGGAAHGDSYQGLELFDAQSVEKGDEVGGQQVQGGGLRGLRDGVPAAGVVPEDLEVGTLALEDGDEGVPHM